MIAFELLRPLGVATVTFILAMLGTPLLTRFLYRHRLGKQIRSAGSTPIYTQLHRGKAGTPTMGGVIVWGTVLVVVFGLAAFERWGGPRFAGWSFLSRSQTYLPLAALVLAAVVGLIDDLYSTLKGRSGVGLRLRQRLLIGLLIALGGAWWFVFRLQWTTIHVPFVGNFDIGLWYLPIFIFIIVATSFSVNEADGLDGLAGGIMLACFAAFAAIAAVQGRLDLATLCAAVIGGLVAFLWFNIPPARFFMGDTGAMGLGTLLGVVAMLTNSVFFLPVIGALFVLESLSVIIQYASKRLRGKKVFLSAPLHHHFEAKGWPESKVVMRAWVLASVSGALGFILFLLDRGAR